MAWLRLSPSLALALLVLQCQHALAMEREVIPRGLRLLERILQCLASKKQRVATTCTQKSERDI
eukprot:13042870-Alexandrium_andersonii.AAC.1